MIYTTLAVVNEKMLQLISTQGLAVALVFGVAVLLAHYWIRHGFPHKVKSDEADLAMRIMLTETGQANSDNNAKALRLLAHHTGKFDEHGERLDTIDTTLGEIRKHQEQNA